MSEPRYDTGNYEVRTCRTCGAEVEHSELAGMYGSAPYWQARKHDAPCGMPCMGGGVRPSHPLFKSAHGWTGKPCPGCGETR